MKKIHIQIVITFDDDPESKPAPVPPKNPLTLLLERLLFETRNGRNSKQWDVPLDCSFLPAVGLDFQPQ
ncbi:MAG: hypothetical protein FWC43_13265 [Planctomycetaceae bacterium]|nr:hypothetical protein [Planctomycetaceae bacterium]